jgi:hypothetical protein
MIVFSDAFSGDPVESLPIKSQAGWSFCFLIIAQIFVNLALYFCETMYKIIRVLKQKYRLW